MDLTGYASSAHLVLALGLLYLGSVEEKYDA